MKQLIPILLFLCPFTLSAQIELMVYPGDTNQDSIVSVRDLLVVGIAYDSTVVPRDMPSLEWTPQFAIGIIDQELANTQVNFAHINSNGDDRIDSLDIDAIALHYDTTVIPGQVIPFEAQWSPQQIAPASFCPRIRLAFDRDTAFVNDTLLADILLEWEPEITLSEEDALLGTAFSMTYDPVNVQDSQTVVSPELSDDGDLMFATARLTLDTVYRNLPQGRIDFGAAGRGINVLQQPRLLGRVRFIVVEDLIIRQEDPWPFVLEVDPTSLLMVNRQELRFDFSLCPPVSDTVFFVDDRPVSVPPAGRTQSTFDVYPNPVHYHFYVECSRPLQALTLFDINGMVKWRKEEIARGNNGPYPIPDLPSGIYLLVGLDQEGKPSSRLLVKYP